jgi:MFS family permease
MLILGVGILSLVQAYPSALLLYASMILYGMGYGFTLPSMMASYADLFQGPRFGAILGTLTLGGLVGAAVGTSVGGHLRDVTGSYQLNFLIATIAFVLSVILIWIARPSGIRVVRKVLLADTELEKQVVGG